MEDDKLEVDAPLRSHRCFPAGAAADGRVDPEPPPAEQLRFCMSDLKSRPVHEPGGVPFSWELKPGEPKNDSSRYGGRLSVAPKPLHGGISKDSSGEETTASAQSTKPGSSVRTRKSAVFGPACGADKCSEVFRENARKVGVKKENDQQPIRSVGDEEEDDDDNDDAFSDALDTLSRTESFFMNCSVSGLSGVPESAKTPCRAAADLQVREFMMGRFLPAAQAMVSAPPQYSSRKSSLPAQEPTGQRSERAAKEERWKAPPFVIQHRPDNALNYIQQQQLHDHHGHDDDEDEEDDDGSVHLTSKGCGFLPHLCVKASLSLLNPLPALKAVGRLPSPSRRRTESLHKSSGQTKAEHSRELVYKRQMGQGAKHDGRNRLTSDYNPLANREEASSSYRNESPHPQPHEEKDFVGVDAGESKSSKIDGFRDDEGYWVITPPHHDGQLVSDLLKPTLEKHLDIDPIAFLEKAESQSSSFSTLGDYVAVIQNKRQEVSLEACPSDTLQPNVPQFLEPYSSDGHSPAKLDGKKDLRHNLESNCWLKKTVNLSQQPILPLPLPKSPSDSWLSRTLSKHPAPQIVQSNLSQHRKQVQMHFIDPKLDACAKTIKVQLRQVRFVEILAMPESPKSEI